MSQGCEGLPQRIEDSERPDILRFQARLIRGLAISSNTSKKWRSQVKGILSEAATVIDVRFMYVFMPGEGDTWDLEFFWLDEPSPETRSSTEALLKRKLAEDEAYRNIGRFNLVHTAVNERLPGTPMAALDADLHCRTFELETPHESGSVGMGLSRRERPHPLEGIAIDSTLASFVNIISVLKALSAYTREIERFAARDSLTNLYNQTSFWDLLRYEASRSKRHKYAFTLLVIDLDNFKAINDSFGHEAGDEFLKDIAVILKNAVRSGDIAARYAGDQFTAILPVCDEGQAHIVARRIIENVRNHARPAAGGVAIKGSVSIGAAVYPDHAGEPKDLFLLADNMLTQAKMRGKDRLSVPSEHDSVEVLKSMGEKSIMILDALANRRIVPYFQPIVEVKTGRIEAFEVLTRIALPDRVVSAAEFIERVEGMGAIGRLDYQLFEHTLAKVRETNYTGSLFINLSPRALVISEFMPTMRRIMRDYELDPAKLIFEITERDTVKNVELFEKFIHELKQDGVRFAIDDFGSGYSSFQYIKTFSVDFLKVDGSFIRSLVDKGMVEKHIVASIAALAKNLQIKTIAECVESREILGEVESAGIDYAQGYFIQRPSPDLL
ncbi:MAG TPA: EAL domain-containing protein [Nitrospirota bacterium]|nr:EAL domain-containing protein [Nitrospirota bacterium]